MERRQGIGYKPDQLEEAKLAYNPSFDERDYKNFSTLSERDQQRLRIYTQRQLETYVGERVQVEESTTRYEILDGKIFSAQANEPLEDMVIRGIEFRREHGNPVDFNREDAELAGIRLVQEELVSDETPLGTTYLVISAPGKEGSDYKNNFFDTISVKKDEGGKYIEHRRFLSNLTTGEYRQRVAPFKIFEKEPTAEEFLEDPIKITGFESVEEVQKYLNGGVKALEKTELEKINRINAPLITSYINSLVDNPNDHFIHRLKYNAILNQTDLVLDAIKVGDRGFLDELYLGYSFNLNYTEDMSWVLGSKKVRQTEGPCPGISGGFNLAGIVEPARSPFSVLDYSGEKAKDDPNLCRCGGNEPHFHCPGKNENGKDCGHAIVVGRGITACPSCGAGKTC